MPVTAEMAAIEPAPQEQTPVLVPDGSHTFAISLMEMLRKDLSRRHETDREMVSVLRELRGVLADLHADHVALARRAAGGA